MAANTSLFSGIVFLLLAGILAASGLLWRNFLEFSGSGNGDSEVFIGLSSQPSPRVTLARAMEHHLRFGFVIPRGDLVEFIEAVQPALENITGSLGYHPVIDVSDSTTELLAKLERGDVQIAAVTAVAYARLRATNKVRPLLERTGSNNKHSLFVVRRDSAFRTLADLQGTRIAYKSRDSLSAYAMPRLELRRQGHDPDTFFRSATFTGNVRTSALGVLNGEFEVAVMSDTFFTELEADVRDHLRILHKTAPIPGGVYLAKATHPPELLDRLTEAFLAKGPHLATREEFAGYFRVKRPDPSLYDFLSEVEDDG